jgi:hypothetical protein
MIPLSEEFTHIEVEGPTTFKNLTLFRLARCDAAVPE